MYHLLQKITYQAIKLQVSKEQYVLIVLSKVKDVELDKYN